MRAKRSKTFLKYKTSITPEIDFRKKRINKTHTHNSSNNKKSKIVASFRPFIQKKNRSF